MAMARLRHPKVIRLRTSTTAIILGLIFVVLGALTYGITELYRLQEFDQRRSFDICLGANQQMERLILKLLEPTVIPDNASPQERAFAEDRNKRVAVSRAQITLIIEENKLKCTELLTSR